MDWADRIGRRIKLRDLHILLAVAEHGSMAKASSQLSVSHPVVSKTISELEKNLGVRLFDRGARGVELTAHGTALLGCGVSVFDEMRQGIKRLEALSDPASGELRIGCSEIAQAGLVPAIIERFFQKYPRIRLHVALAQTLRELRERNIDLLIGRVSQGLSADDVNSETLFDEPFVAVAGTNSKFARRRHPTLQQLMTEHWVLPPYDSMPGSLIAGIFRTSKLQPPQPSVVTLSGQLTVTLIASGRFVGVLPSSVARFHAKPGGLKILPLDLPVAHIAASIVTVKNRTLSPAAQLFIESAREARKSIANPTPVAHRSAVIRRRSQDGRLLGSPQEEEPIGT
jgi:DNA-binding transcriptional LysR family regulator